MSREITPSHAGRAAPCAVVSIAVLLVGLWPWLASLALWPMAADSPSWFELSDPAAPGWTDWVFRTRHFGVGYRPLTALSFSATTAWLGGSALAARLTDLALHAGAAVGVYALGRALAPRSSRLGPILAMALFLAHPIADEVVPILARRSYSLSLGLSTWALVGVAAGVRAGTATRRIAAGFAAGLVLAAAWFANEVAALAVFASPLVAWAARGEGGLDERARERVRRAAQLLGPAAVPVLAAVLVRARVLGELGGYEVDEEAAASAGSLVLASLRQLLGTARGQPLAGVLGPGAVAGLAAAAVVAALLALRRRAPVAHGEALGVALVGALWLAIGVATYALLGVLYPRQLYVLAAPLALAVGLPLGSLVRAARGVPLVVGLALNALALAGILAASPVLRGQDGARLALWRERQLVMEALVEAGRSASEPATLVLVLPANERGGRGGGARLHAVDVRRGGRKPAFLRWVEFELRGRDVLLEEFVELTGAAGRAEALTLERAGALTFLVLPEGVEARAAAGRLPRGGGDPRRIRVPTSGDRSRSRYLFTWTAGEGRLAPL